MYERVIKIFDKCKFFFFLLVISSFFTLKSCLRWHQAALANDYDMLSIFQVNTKLWQ